MTNKNVLVRRTRDDLLLDVEKASAMLAACLTADAAKGIRDRALAVQVFYRESKAGLEAQNRAAEVALKAMRRMGELLAAGEKHPGGRPPKTRRGGAQVPTLEEMGIDRRTASTAQRLAAISPTDFAGRLEKTKAKAERITVSGILAASMEEGYDGDEHGTPPEWLTRVRRALGGRIWVDMCSSRKANERVGAETYYTKERPASDEDVAGEDGVWFQPPYSKGLIDELVPRALLARTMISLTNHAPDTAWFQALMGKAEWVFFPAERINFLHPVHGEPTESNRYAQAFTFHGLTQAAVTHGFHGAPGTLLRVVGHYRGGK